MFKSKLSLDFALANKDKLVKAEMRCYKCCGWFDVTNATLKLIDNYLNKDPGTLGVAIEMETCTNCGKKQMVHAPGKYDSIKAKNPNAQRYQFGE